MYDFLDSIEYELLSAAIITDISKDGMMEGTNLKLIQRLNENYPINFIASGGVCAIKDITALKEMNIYGAIIGKAFYENTLTLTQVLNHI